MNAPLSSMIVEGIVSLSTKVAVDGIVKIATPAGVRAVNGFAIKAGAFLIGTFFASKLSAIAVKNTEDLVAIVKATPQSITDVEPPQADS